MPVTSHYLLRRDFRAVFTERVKEWDKKKYSMTAGTSRYAYYGLVPGHAYTVLGVYELKGEKVLKLHNPWSKEKYTGPWRDNDPRWTADLRR